MPPGYAPMPSPGYQGQPVYLPQPQYNQMPQQYNQAPPQYVQTPIPQRPVIRAAPPDQKTVVQPEPPRLPAPESVGIKSVKPGEVDWNATHAYMVSIGVKTSTMERVENGYRFSVVMPTAEAARPTYRIEGVGPTEAEAVRSCLDKTYCWLKQIK
jgi:hypothetical protein